MYVSVHCSRRTCQRRVLDSEEKVFSDSIGIPDIDFSSLKRDPEVVGLSEQMSLVNAAIVIYAVSKCSRAGLRGTYLL